MSELDPRKQRILRAVVIEYVVEAEPIGSEQLVQKYELGVKSATVRNELAEMSELGFLEQPHTSAGRIPSDVGYRYFVDRLATIPSLDSEVKGKVTEVTGRSEALRSLLIETTKLLSRTTHQLAAASAYGDVHLQIRHVIVTALGPGRALLVVVFNNGDVENRMLELPAELTLVDLGMINEKLPETIQNKTVRAVSRMKTPTVSENPELKRAFSHVFAQIKSIAKDRLRSQVVVQGEEYIFAQPELRRDAGLFQSLIAHLEDEDRFAESLSNPTDSPQHFSIGRENELEELRHFSILRQNYTIAGEHAGTLAVIGPTRMPYESTISALQYFAEAVGNMLTKMMDPPESAK